MEQKLDKKIILITRKTRIEDLIARFNTVSQAKFYIEHLGADFRDYENEHKTYHDAVFKLEEELRRWAILHKIDRSFLPTYLFGPEDIIVALGQDGLVANTMKYLSGQVVIGVNPDVSRWDGILLPFVVSDIPILMKNVVKKDRRFKEITMAKAELNNGQALYAVNDIFIGPKSHTSARYSIDVNNKTENQSSSGVIVSTGLGSTGWFKSILEGATGIAGSLFSKPLNLKKKGNFPWDSKYLYFSVREPFPSKTTTASVVFGQVTQNSPLTLISHTPENGVIFSDGIEADFLEFNSGTKAVINIADKIGRLIV